MAYTVNNTSVIAQNNQVSSLAGMVQSPAIINRYRQVIGDKAPAFLAGVLGAVNANNALKNADPNTVLASAMVAATLNLSCVPSLGQAALVPYKGSVQFQVMTRGLVQLAQRTGQYKAINTGKVYEDEYDGEDLLSGEVMFHRVSGGYRDQGDESKVVGYFAFIRTITGFEHTEYWTRDDVVNHGKKFSKSFYSGPWKDNFDAMAQKTVLKSCLNHYGPMSVESEMAKALAKDQVVVDKNGNESFEDNPLNDVPMTMTAEGEVVEDVPTKTVEQVAESSKYDDVEEI